MIRDTIYQIDYEGPEAENFVARSEPISARATGGSGVVVYGIDTGQYLKPQYGGLFS